MNQNIKKQYELFNTLRRKYKFTSDKKRRMDLQGKLIAMQVYSDVALKLNQDLTEDERYLLESMVKINISRPND